MKIRNVSCRQFAGVRNQNVAFTDGINVVFGKNESGKSTLVNLLSRTLFQDAKLSKSRKSDKEFSELYFPSKKKNGIAGDFVDGTVEFETSDGQYALYKEWGTQGRVQLSTPDGEFRDPGKINELMKDVLVYGEGVYTDLLMTSQQ
ncbi:MAG: AAA family ATPase, partial [Erysipelotrichaceae bacterium]|nr:AAA family ATPase [Erysipelotrichaceae bacterium]